MTIEKKNGNLVFVPEKETRVGVVFYPGALVDYDAYAPLLSSLAEEGVLAVDVKMPMNFAFFGISKANKVLEAYPEIDHWYIAGHSLGGAMASYYLDKNSAKYDGLILLASYSTKDLSDDNLKILSLYGSEDQVLNKKNYEKYKTNLGAYLETVIEGGCHAFFGSYGAQKGDGTPTISKEVQTEEAKEEILRFIAF
ncbi:MAG: hypothetical protein KBS81_01945 [Spirochaetales bacterium]|nr:hypothetical protein [Candidatus Physcosoma equi]